MSAKITIVTNEVQNVLAVPNECISNNNEGQTILNVTTDDGATTTEVVVETGLTDGTVTEVKGEGISEGTKVVVPQAEDFTLDPLA